MEKTKVMETSATRDEGELRVENYVLEKVQGFKYLRVTITGNNDSNAETARRLLRAERAFFR